MAVGNRDHGRRQHQNRQLKQLEEEMAVGHRQRWQHQNRQLKQLEEEMAVGN